MDFDEALYQTVRIGENLLLEVVDHKMFTGGYYILPSPSKKFCQEMLQKIYILSVKDQTGIKNISVINIFCYSEIGVSKGGRVNVGRLLVSPAHFSAENSPNDKN